MSIFRRRTGQIKHSIWFNARIAHYVIPLIEMLCRDDGDGDAYRSSLREWHHAERPVLDLFRGPVSMLRIDGPRHYVGDHVFPMGALIESPGVTAHLDPVEARELENRMRHAIEDEILLWIAEHGLQHRPPVESCVDRAIADTAAVERMTRWAAHEARQGGDRHAR